MQVQQILKELESYTGKFPRQAVQAAVEQRDEITPHLLECLERTAADPVKVLSEAKYQLPLYAMYLLAQFREPRAYRPLLSIFATPETSEAVDDATGDLVTENLGRILASVCHGDVEPLKRMIEDRSLAGYTRCAGVTALVTLVNCGEQSRDDVMACFKELFGKLEREPAPVWDGLVDSCLYLYPEEVLEEIAAAFDEGLIQGFFVDPENVCRACRQGKESVLEDLKSEQHHLVVQDVVAEMEWWACFNPPPKPPAIKMRRPEVSRARNPISKLGALLTPPLTQPKKQVVGRNDPCPCGSGKKFKKCCGG